MNMLSEALLCTDRGWLVFPCSPRTKKPLTPNGLDDATRDREQISKWWSAFPDAMIAVRTGSQSGLFVVDLDVDPTKSLDGIAAFAGLLNGHQLPETIVSHTPRGGQHLFFRWVDGVKNRVGGARKNDTLPRGVDVRGEGGYAIVPPSRRADGCEYAFIHDDPNGPAAAPPWLLELLLPKRASRDASDAYVRAALDRECAAIANAQPGARNHQLNTAAFNLGQLVAAGLLSDGEVRQRLFEAATACGLVADDGPQAAINTINSGLSSGMTQPRQPRGTAQPNSGQQQRQQQQSTGAATVAPASLVEVLRVFKRWLILPSATPIYAVLGTVAANLLPGEPVWLGLVAPPSSAKTEILNSLSGLPNVVQVATITSAGLLSGTPKKQQAHGARGGLLQQIGSFGIICLKDFGSVLSMHPETKSEVLAALREIYDGSWTRHLGTDGGKTLSWKGKVALIFASTQVIDAHYSVIGQMGDRFLMCRMRPTSADKQIRRALDHTGATFKQMRTELAEVVARLFAGRRTNPSAITEEEIATLSKTLSLVVRLRGAVTRDPRSREIETVYGLEGAARLGLTLERLLAGLDTLGMSRKRALRVVQTIALNSAPPLRRKAYQTINTMARLRGSPAAGALKTTDVAIALGLPTVTVRRILEELEAHGLLARHKQGQGKADLWERAEWEARA